MANSKKYWKGIEQLKETAAFQDSSNKEFSEQLPIEEFLGDENSLGDAGTTRRDFLKYLGFGLAAASLAACETPVTKAIPYLNKPEEITPGIANYYATTFYDGLDYCPILVKTREGRPIFIKGNVESSLTKGEINARVNSSVLSLYDNTRLKSPMINGEEATWVSIDNRLGKELKSAKNIKVLANTIISPSTKSIIGKLLNDDLINQTVSNNFIQYDSISYSGMLDANLESFNKRAIPTYNLDKAKSIVSVGADFLAGWLDSLQYNVGYASGRNPEKEWMSKHFQFEANMSLTGTNADVRIPVKPSEYGSIIGSLYNKVAVKVGANKIIVTALNKVHDRRLNEVAEHLLLHKGESVVFCGSNDKSIQLLVNGLNNLLGNYGKTIDIEKTSYVRQGSDKMFTELVKEMESGSVDALLIYGVDPVFTSGEAFKKALKKVKTSVSFAVKMNETSAECKYVCPDNHFLESWNDARPVDGHYSLAQPTISQLFDTRQAQESMMKWAGVDGSYYQFIKSSWETTIFPQSGSLMFTDFWNKTLHDGVVDVKTPLNRISIVSPFSIDVNSVANNISKQKSTGIELVLYIKEGIGDGLSSDNPILQELPDPVSKITWDNYVTMNPSEMENAGYNVQLGQESPANIISVTANGTSLELPVVSQPGQAKGTIGIALGYGKNVGKMADPTGKNAFPFVLRDQDGNISYTTSALVTDIDGTYPIAITQMQHTVMGRDSIIRETTLDVFKDGDKSDFNPSHTLIGHKDGKSVNVITKEFNIWGKDQPVEKIGHRWGMSIDLNTCTGCGACVTACNIENNIAIIGKDEMRRGRSMHWLRIDRYYASEYQDAGDIAGTLEKTKEAEDVGTTFGYKHMEDPADNPLVVHQPMMCQHCNHAGCETVCPVAATTHSNEGLNMMTYNRCIGTRYCANNCAYKVRRFNWYNYTAYKKFSEFNPSQDDLGRMVLNPDVVVRSRGVMEKCSMCVQSIQAAKLQAKIAGKPVEDGDVDCACSSVCGSGAIVFGDLNDTKSKVRAGMENDRAYRVIEEKGQEPNIFYQTKVRNLASSKTTKNHGHS